ncbi:hypothetical protein C8Q74DRAFT_372074 [Fomes fomentarius]|nr:hypothetical protein C8Q74DRAFT_372074 [Fomes fomentarius]
MSPNPSNTTTLMIAIMSGSLARLTLPLTLHRRGVFATLYERDTNLSARAHLGGVRDLGWTSGSSYPETSLGSEPVSAVA